MDGPKVTIVALSFSNDRLSIRLYAGKPVYPSLPPERLVTTCWVRTISRKD